MTKDELVNYRTLALEARGLKDRLSAMENSIYSPRNQRYTSTPGARSGKGIELADVVDRHIKLERRYRAALAEVEAQQLAIETAIESLPDAAERVVMRERYLACRSWRSICALMAGRGYSERQVYRMHGFALLRLKGEEDDD